MRSETIGRKTFVLRSLVFGSLQGLAFGFIAFLEPRSIDLGAVIVMGVFGSLSMPLFGLFGTTFFMLICVINFLSGLRYPLSWTVEAVQGALTLAMVGLTAAGWSDMKKRLRELSGPPAWQRGLRWTAFLPVSGTAAYWCLALFPAPLAAEERRPVLRGSAAAFMALAAGLLLWAGLDAIRRDSGKRLEQLKTQLESPQKEVQ